MHRRAERDDGAARRSGRGRRGRRRHRALAPQPAAERSTRGPSRRSRACSRSTRRRSSSRGTRRSRATRFSATPRRSSSASTSCCTTGSTCRALTPSAFSSTFDAYFGIRRLSGRGAARRGSSACARRDRHRLGLPAVSRVARSADCRRDVGADRGLGALAADAGARRVRGRTAGAVLRLRAAGLDQGGRHHVDHRPLRRRCCRGGGGPVVAACAASSRWHSRRRPRSGSSGLSIAPWLAPLVLLAFLVALTTGRLRGWALLASSRRVRRAHGSARRPRAAVCVGIRQRDDRGRHGTEGVRQPARRPEPAPGLRRLAHRRLPRDPQAARARLEPPADRGRRRRPRDRRRMGDPRAALAGAGARGRPWPSHACTSSRRARPWADGKALAITAPLVLLGAMLGVAALARPMPGAGWVLGLVLAGGVLASNALAYHQVVLAPRDRLEELAKIGQQFDGRGPALAPDQDDFSKHFLRDAAPSTADGQKDLDELELSDVERFPLIVAPRRSARLAAAGELPARLARALVRGVGAQSSGSDGHRPPGARHARQRCRHRVVCRRSPAGGRGTRPGR